MTARRGTPGTTEGLDPALNAVVIYNPYEDGVKPPVKPVEARAGVCTQCGKPTDNDTGWCRACLAREDERRAVIAQRSRPASPARAPRAARDVSTLVVARDELNRAMGADPGLRTPENFRRRDALNDRIGGGS